MRGCAMGQEPYTLCMMLADNLGRFAFNNLTIHATDMDDQDTFGPIVTSGVYAKGELERMPAKAVETYFEPAGTPEHLRVVDRIRSRLLFQKHNLLSCRGDRTELQPCPVQERAPALPGGGAGGGPSDVSSGAGTRWPLRHRADPEDARRGGPSVRTAAVPDAQLFRKVGEPPVRVIPLEGSGETYTCNVYLVLGSWSGLGDMNTLVDVGQDPVVLAAVEHAPDGGWGKTRVEQVILDARPLRPLQPASDRHRAVTTLLSWPTRRV